MKPLADSPSKNAYDELAQAPLACWMSCERSQELLFVLRPAASDICIWRRDTPTVDGRWDSEQIEFVAAAQTRGAITTGTDSVLLLFKSGHFDVRKITNTQQDTAREIDSAHIQLFSSPSSGLICLAAGTGPTELLWRRPDTSIFQKIPAPFLYRGLLYDAGSYGNIGRVSARVTNGGAVLVWFASIG